MWQIGDAVKTNPDVLAGYDDELALECRRMTLTGLFENWVQLDLERGVYGDDVAPEAVHALSIVDKTVRERLFELGLPVDDEEGSAIKVLEHLVTLAGRDYDLLPIAKKKEEPKPEFELGQTA